MAAGWVVVDDGVRLWFDVEGDGVPVVLCHGGPGLWDNLGPLARLVTRCNMRDQVELAGVEAAVPFAVNHECNARR